jgi:hypothetical protein
MSYNRDMFPELNSDDDRLRVRMVLMSHALDCAHGHHRTETDPETGDEVCRFCGVIVE